MRLPFVKQLSAGVIAVTLALVAPIAAAATGDEVWAVVKASLFGEREIAPAGFEMSLTLPLQAEDAAVVPVSMKAHPRKGQGMPRKLYLIIDRNPSPVAGVFEFGDVAGGAQIETRVRIETASTVRVVAEAPDGSLTMVTKYIKASGGCSTASGTRSDSAATRGQMRWQLPELLAMGRPNAVTLMIRHPNSSGLAADQSSRIVEAPGFVRRVKVTWRGQLVVAADVDFSISENPTLRFSFKPDGEGALAAEVEDTDDVKYESSVAIGPGQ